MRLALVLESQVIAPQLRPIRGLLTPHRDAYNNLPIRLEACSATCGEPGGYTLVDFIRIGVPLAAIVLVVTVLLVPLFFPF